MKSKKKSFKKKNSDLELSKNQNTSDLDTSLKVSDISFKKKVFDNLENLILNELEYFIYNKPFDIAARCINEVNNKLLIKEPKIITTKIISTKIIKMQIQNLINTA